MGEGASVSFDFDWPHPLFPYQREGVRCLANEASVLLADEMGLGKTIQAIAALRILFDSRKAAAALVVVPSSLALQWRQQFREWAPELKLSTVIGAAAHRHRAWRSPAQVFIVGYEGLRSDIWMSAPHGPAKRGWDAVILDEAQRIKDAASELSKAVKKLDRARSWALTGTPLENRLDDLLSILDFVAPGRFDKSQKAVGLRRLLAEVQLRRRRKDVLPELPPKLTTTLHLPLGSQQRQAYLRAEEEGIVHLQSLGRKLRVTHVLELILRLKQICNFCPETGQSTKLLDLRARLAILRESREKALVFSQFVEEPFGIRRLARELADHSPFLFSGEHNAATRAKTLAEFERDPNRSVMLLSLRAGGVGLNLTTASYVFHFDRWWNPAVEAQAEDRAHRIGQKRTVQVYSYLSPDTVEERIQEILLEKRALFADIVDQIDTGALRRLDLDTLLAAIRLG